MIYIDEATANALVLVNEIVFLTEFIDNSDRSTKLYKSIAGVLLGVCKARGER